MEGVNIVMFKKSNDMEKEFREKMRGGEGTVEITHIFKEHELTGKSRMCAKVTLKPGCSIGMHIHENEEEIYYFIKGKGKIVDNGEQRDVCVGDAVLTGGGAAHSVENNGSEDLEFMAIILTY